MARKGIVYSPVHPYHITARANNKEWFGLTSEKTWVIFNDYLYFCAHAFNVRIHAFVLMKNHFHLLATFPENNLSLFKNRFLTETARAINYERSTINHVYGDRSKTCLIDDDFYFINALRYIYRNPVKAGYVERCEDYPWSTLSGLIGNKSLLIPLKHPEYPSVPSVENIDQLLSWVNYPNPIPDEIMSKNLRKLRFNTGGKDRNIIKNINAASPKVAGHF